MKQTEPVTDAQAAEAIESLDDCARMTIGVDASGPREVLYRYIEQHRAQAAELERLRAQNQQVAWQIVSNEQSGAVQWAKGLTTSLDDEMHVERIPACWIDGDDLDQLAQYGMGGVLGWADDGNDPRRVPVYR
ncbi:hypothetical protein [Roseateles asaccharophilus]|uniref:Uncharacterized protein n=1 Tax=Roseateles asaccharophilus TaxID=582607 RepID=A0ABU2A6S1_9BURK|nr:hypothetical protein [Roseateles asaccharophilus]MDR7331728.1 hypothetical protein [Roseateles asaccharophilus]